MPELLFHGAAGEVTGSMHMVHIDGQWVALDCGMFQGRRSESEEKNRQWPMPPKDIAAVVLSHAHIDHTGRLPRLVRDGFEGPVFCTSATRDLCAIMLPDSAHIQEEDSYYVNKRRKRKGLDPIEPLYTYNDAVAALKLIQTVPYDHWFDVVDGLRASFREAGHMLGSAGIRLAFGKRNGEAPNLYFTGDVGRREKPILRDPRMFPECDAIICESTYGGRVSERVVDAKDKLAEIVQRTYDRKGKVIIPAFSVGRTQSIVYFMHELILAGELPRWPIFVDSPLAVNATEVFKMHPECFDAEARAFHRVTGDILGGNLLTYIRDVEESKKLHFRKEPCTIISASGMCEAGRIRHHIKNNVGNPNNTLLVPGYQAAHTLGRRLVEGAKSVTLFHEDFPVRCEVQQIHGFSGHADQQELHDLIAPLCGTVKDVYLVHGETDQAEAFATLLRENHFGRVTIAQRDLRVTL